VRWYEAGRCRICLLKRNDGVVDMSRSQEPIPGFEIPVHRALTEPILLAGAPRSLAILNGTIAAAMGLGLRLWLVGLGLWVFGHMAAVWAAKRDPSFVEVVRRHIRYPTYFGT
jgi:type IV secretion system protein TrbD